MKTTPCSLINGGTTARKVRGDAKLEQLNAEQQEQLRFWLEENCTYFEVVRLVREEFGVSVGKSAVSAYYRKHVLSVQQQDEAETVAALTALPAADFDAATLQHARLLAWTALARPDPDVDLGLKLLAIIGRAERHALALKRLALEERKLALREKLATERVAAAERKNAVRREAQPAAEATTAGVGERVPSPDSLTFAATKGSETAEQKNACDVENLPRFPSYSEVRRPEAEAQSRAIDAMIEAGRKGTNDTMGSTETAESADHPAGVVIFPRQFEKAA